MRRKKTSQPPELNSSSNTARISRRKATRVSIWLNDDGADNDLAAPVVEQGGVGRIGELNQHRERLGLRRHQFPQDQITQNGARVGLSAGFEPLAGQQDHVVVAGRIHVVEVGGDGKVKLQLSDLDPLCGKFFGGDALLAFRGGHLGYDIDDELLFGDRR